ncbi:CGNR zinc finger domain-containing protein [Actinomycetospora sp. NBRC 106378]|uniref:CGNR zinc finger domain-containing protein n=1 Tax=Actinomycetospora sp. NBRC 106378 TaxID=3032208 RepID=UPI0024A19EBA|nr:CGNR zinc finger domain-containing protein [Actinomycetospora sp. NBRC 106378]GLZ53507.1 hypothetical protein Acsp07_31240 [Actinomycetospora sp. NBRC 106378]
MTAPTAGASERDAVNSAELVIRFVNTRAAGNGQPELIADGSAFREWLLHEHLVDGADPVTDADAAMARELREALAVLLVDHVGAPIQDGALAAAEKHLHRAAGLHPVNLLVGAGGCEITSPQTGVASAIGRILAAIFRAATEGLWARSKMCSNPPCHAGFLDHTRNSAGLYCSSTCRSQMSMRAYRERRRTESDPGEPAGGRP